MGVAYLKFQYFGILDHIHSHYYKTSYHSGNGYLHDIPFKCRLNKKAPSSVEKHSTAVFVLQIY